MQRISEQTQQELTIQNLIEINQRLTGYAERFKPEIQISFDEKEKNIDVVLKLNGKTVSTTITEHEMDYYPVEDQIRYAAGELLDPFRTMIGELIAKPIEIINKNKTITEAKS